MIIIIIIILIYIKFSNHLKNIKNTSDNKKCVQYFRENSKEKILL